MEFAQSTLTKKDSEPFVHGVVDNFLTEEAFDYLSEQLLNEQFSEKHSDLFRFFQTQDLSAVPQFAAFSSFLTGAFREQLQALTGLRLGKQLDMQGHMYADANYLLCHDDQLDSRAIAFILYLTDLEEGEGGELVLYPSKDGVPTREGAKKILPQANRLVWFKVTDTSFHEVLEVLADTQRVTIGGWLHHD